MELHNGDRVIVRTYQRDEKGHAHPVMIEGEVYKVSGRVIEVLPDGTKQIRQFDVSQIKEVLAAANEAQS